MILAIATYAFMQWIECNLPEESSIVQFSTIDASLELAERYQLCIVEERLEQINELDASYIYAPGYSSEQIGWFLPERIDLVVLPAGINGTSLSTMKGTPFLVVGTAEEVAAVAEVLERPYEMGEDFGLFPVVNDESIQ